MKEQTIFQLRGQLKQYDWGGISYLPTLLGFKNLEAQPFAEYWLGTHPSASAIFYNSEKSVLLQQKVELTYLFKILDVAQMLSIQVHPSKEQAEIGFEKENEAKIPMEAPNRNYKDCNHKPEMAIALDEFWLIHGFKTVEKILQILNSIPEFDCMGSIFEREGTKGLYNYVMTTSQENVNDILTPLLARIIPCYNLNEYKKSDENYWAAKAALTFNKEKICDRGIFSIYFFNLVCLQKGEGIVQLSGVPHAYLQGQCVEIMANSDNVLRAGLTTKHIDIAELLKIVKIEPTVPDILHGIQTEFETNFPTEVSDFKLSLFKQKIGEASTFFPNGTEIVFVTKGGMLLECEGLKIELKQGDSAVLFSGKQIQMTSLLDAEIYKASGSKEIMN